MINTSLLKVLDIFKNNAKNHKSVQTAQYGTLIQLLERPSVNYSDVFVLFNSSTISDNKINYNLSLVVSDLITSSDDNVINIWNAAHKIGEEIIYYTNNTNRRFLEIDLSNITTQPFYNGRVDKVAGITFTFNVEVFNNQSGCELPIVNPVIPPVVSCTPPLNPTILPEEGSYRTDLQQISFESTQDFVGFYYTVDGSTPTTGSTLYSQPFNITQQGEITVKVIAVGYNGLSSGIVSSTYQFTYPTAEAPIILPNNGSYTAPLPITITSPEGLDIYYTTDGSTPTTASTLYTGAFQLSAGTFNVKAICAAPLYNPSPVSERNYQVNNINTLALAVASGGRAYLTNDENISIWTELRPTGDINRDYTSCYASRGSGEFGRYIYLGISGGGPGIQGTWRSSDYGATWSLIPGSGTNVLGSKNGQYIYTFTPGNNTYTTSSDFGATFTTRTFAGGTTPWRMTCSDNGQYVFFSTFASRNPLVSSDFGVNFTIITGANVSTTSPAALSNDGSIWFTANFANAPNGLFRKWTGFGASNTQFQLDANPVSYVYTRIACDETATNVITCRGRDAAINTGRVFINTSGGNSTGWTEVAPTGTPTDLEWTNVSTSGDKWMVSNTTRLYASLNGTTWFETQPAGNINRFWLDCKIYKL